MHDNQTINDTELLNRILSLDLGTITNVIQSAAELVQEGTLHERLQAGYEEHTNQYDDEGNLLNA